MNSYTNIDRPEKTRWRASCWSLAAKHLHKIGIRPNHAKVLYMPSSNDLDYAEALHQGFRPYNMFACELDGESYKKIKKARPKTLVFNCDIASALRASDHGYFDLVFLDMLGSYSPELVSACAHSLNHCIVIGNFRRGQDRKVNDRWKNRNGATRFPVVSSVSDYKNIGLHRGLRFHHETADFFKRSLYSYIQQKICKDLPLNLGVFTLNSKSESSAFKIDGTGVLDKIENEAREYFYSKLITSGSHKAINGIATYDYGIFEVRNSVFHDAVGACWNSHGEHLETRKTFVALKAHRTRRMQ